jgi:hypothetical protein
MRAYLLLCQIVHHRRERYHRTTPWRHLKFILASIDEPILQTSKANHVRATFIAFVWEVHRNDICPNEFIQANGALLRHRAFPFLPCHFVRRPICRLSLEW